MQSRIIRQGRRRVQLRLHDAEAPILWNVATSEAYDGIPWDDGQWVFSIPPGTYRVDGMGDRTITVH